MNELKSIAIAIYLLHLLLLLDSVPVWLVLAAACAALWKTVSMRRSFQPLPRLLISALGTMAFSLATVDAPLLWHRQTATHLVVIVGMMLILDRSSKRQIMLVHASLFAMLVAILLSKGPLIPLPVYFSLTSLTMISLMLHHMTQAAGPSLWSLGKKLLATALPVACVLLTLYFFFPEIRPTPTDYAITGISDSLEPGRIASLATSDRLAFRVRFSKAPEGSSAPDFYWRSTVLEESHGMIWRHGPHRADDPLRPTRLAAPIAYEMMSEPRLGSVLPLLEQTLYILPRRKTEIGVYWQASQRSYRTALPLVEVGAALGASWTPPLPPPDASPTFPTSRRVSIWAARLAQLPLHDRIDSILEHFRGYSYSLDPGALDGSDQLDQFLFEGRQGYCEHFAAAFASLMLLTGTPARIVTGFHGGDALGSGQYWQLLDRDAHAWTEIWDGRSWIRIDPTRVVPGGMLLRAKTSLVPLPNAWMDYWTRVLSDRLRGIAQDMGMIWLVVFSLAGILLVMQMIRWTRSNRRQEAWARPLKRFFAFARRAGYERLPGETFGAFLDRVKGSFPEETAAFDVLRRTYNKVRYGPPDRSSSDTELKQQLEALHQRLKASGHKDKPS